VEFCKQCPEKCKQAIPGTVVLSCNVYLKYLNEENKKKKKEVKQKKLDEKVELLNEIQSLPDEKIIKRKRGRPKKIKHA